MAAQPVTERLVRWRQRSPPGSRSLGLDELHDLAHRFLQRERSDHTLRSTARVREGYLRLVYHGPIDTQNHVRFVAIAARLMRQILFDYSHHHRADKRGANCTLVREEALVLPKSRSADVIALDDALTDLARIDEQQSRIVELRFFGGLIIEEINCSVSPQLRSNAIGASPKPGCPDR